MQNDPLPTISVITICKNTKDTIERALQSVTESKYPHLQYVVVDGGSTDGTLDIIDRYRTSLHKFISEPDRGISDALNKAISLTDGEYHITVHADDKLLPGALETLGSIAARTKAQVVCGSAAVVDGDKVMKVFLSDPSKLTRKMSIPHMGALIRKQAWESIGGYDLRKRIAMDHLFMLKLLHRYGPQGFAVVDAVVATYSLGGLSDRFIQQGFREVRDNLIEEGMSPIEANWAYQLLLIKLQVSKLLGRK